MSWVAVGVGAATLAAGAYTGYQSKEAAKDAANAAKGAGAQSEALNIERYGQAGQYLNPYMERELQSSNQLMYEMGLTPYMGDTVGTERVIGESSTATPEQLAEIEALRRKIAGDTGGSLKFGDYGRMKTPQAQELLRQLESQAGVGIGGSEMATVRNIGPNTGAPAYQRTPAYERMREAGIAGVNQGAVNNGILYSGTRGRALSDVSAGVENQFYNNYMNMLQGMASPGTTTNYSSLGMGQGASIGAQGIGVAGNASDYALQGTAASNAAISDAATGLTNIYAGYMGSKKPQQNYVGTSSPYGYGTNPAGDASFVGDVSTPASYLSPGEMYS